MVEQVFHQQGFITGGSHLGYKDNVIGIDHRLVHVGHFRVHSVPHLVCQGEYIVEGALEVEQHKGVGASAGAVSARALAHVLVHVDPPAFKARPQTVEIVLAQRRQRLEHQLLGFRKGELHLHIPHHIGVQVVEMQLLHPQQLLAQAGVPVQLGQILPHCVDQAVIDALRHLRPIQGSGQGGGIVPCLGEEPQLFGLGGQGGGQGVLVALVDPVQGLERGFAQGAIGAVHHGDIGTVGHMVRRPLGVNGVRKGQVSVIEHGEDIVGIVRQLPSHGQQPFLRRREDVGTAAADLIQVTAIALQRRNILIKLFQLLVRDGQDLIGLKGGGGVELGHEVGQLGAHLLGLGGTGVLVRPPEGVDRQTLEDTAHLISQLQPVVEQLCALPQATLVALDIVQIILVPLKIFLPFGIAAIQVSAQVSAKFTSLRSGIDIIRPPCLILVLL